MTPKIPALLKNVFLITIVVIIAFSWALKVTYDSYLTRKKIEEGFLIITAVQNRIEEYATEHSGFSYNEKLENESFGLPNPFLINGTYINQVTAEKLAKNEQITIIVTINTSKIPGLENGDSYPLQTPHIRFNGKYIRGKMIWQCSSDLAQKYLPDNCHGT